VAQLAPVGAAAAGVKPITTFFKARAADDTTDRVDRLTTPERSPSRPLQSTSTRAFGIARFLGPAAAAAAAAAAATTSASSCRPTIEQAPTGACSASPSAAVPAEDSERSQCGGSGGSGGAGASGREPASGLRESAADGGTRSDSRGAEHEGKAATRETSGSSREQQALGKVSSSGTSALWSDYYGSNVVDPATLSELPEEIQREVMLGVMREHAAGPPGGRAARKAARGVAREPARGNHTKRMKGNSSCNIHTFFKQP
jgi:hypothetical protein